MKIAKSELTRRELYGLVWKKPVEDVAKEFGGDAVDRASSLFSSAPGKMVVARSSTRSFPSPSGMRERELTSRSCRANRNLRF